jgi:flavin reductase (DIM6/NTAB) family NADH-FMN oxidoreductase RutF
LNNKRVSGKVKPDLRKTPYNSSENNESLEREVWKGGNMLYPVPVVLIGVRGKNGEKNLFTVAWTGTICTNPPMVSISVRPERYSYQMLVDTGEFSLNLSNASLARAVDYCGVKSGRDTDKWKATSLTPVDGELIAAPLVGESPISMECKIVEKKVLGSHTIFMAEVLRVHAAKRYMDYKNSFRLDKSNPIVYSHGEYYTLGKKVGSFGYSVKRKKKQ